MFISPMRLPYLLLPALLAAGALTLTSAPAQQQILQDQESTPGPLTAWLDGEHALGDLNGTRTFLENKGVEFFGGYTAEVWGNTRGGLKTGAVYTGLLDFGLNLDFEKLVGWQGASFSTTWLWLSGRDASEDLVGNSLTISNIAGFNTFRNLELWFQQELWARENGPALLSLRVGQLTADSEFLISDYAATFINGTFGWPDFAYTNLPEGGPGYPMGAPGVRLAVSPTPWLTVLAAAYQGNVFAQNVNRAGFYWRLDRTQGYTWLGESQFRWNHAAEETGLPGQLKLGAWFSSANFAAASGDTIYWGNSGYYAVLDQMLFREGEPATPPTDGKTTAKSFKEPVPLEKSSQGLDAFGRISFNPQDRNTIGFYFDAGLVYTGLIPGRDDDQLGLALGFADLSNGAAQTLFDEGSRQVGYEAVLELTYVAQITPWLSLQPDAQYIIRPGSTGDLGNAFVLGARAAVTF